MLQFGHDFGPDLLPERLQLLSRDFQLFRLQKLAQDLRRDFLERIVGEYLINLSKIVRLEYLVLQVVHDEQRDADYYLLSFEQKSCQYEHLRLVVHVVEEKCDEPLESDQVQLILMILHMRDKFRKPLR